MGNRERGCGVDNSLKGSSGMLDNYLRDYLNKRLKLSNFYLIISFLN